MPGNIGEEAKSVAGAITSMRIDELISNMAIGIARGQLELDKVCMDIAKFMGDARVAFGKRADSEEPDLLSLIELGFTPNFYQFVDTILEVRLAVSSRYEEERELGSSFTAYHSDEAEQQSQYESASKTSYKSSQSSYSYGGFNWWFGSVRGSGVQGNTGYSSDYASSYKSASSYKAKNLSVTTVDAKYSSAYNYSVEGSSLMKTKIVPIPPPAVFEEILRAKIQERKDWENRMRWLDQLEAILPAIINNINTMLDDNTVLKNVSAASLSLDQAKLINAKISKLKDEYAKITTDHWTVIDNLKEREKADNAMNGAIQKAGDLVKCYEQTPQDEEKAAKLITDLINTVVDDTNKTKGDLIVLNETIKGIKAVLFPDPQA